jgi:hypothetical protein
MRLAHFGLDALRGGKLKLRRYQLELPSEAPEMLAPYYPQLHANRTGRATVARACRQGWELDSCFVVVPAEHEEVGA